ncbi:MAG: AMP-binding protein, partial [Oscillospiraceae bacterium]|nr:AMP-binding protein [Oscillospiraceae bacterium]
MHDDMLNITVGKLLEEVANKYPDKEAIKYTDRPYCRTWKEFNEESERIARGFMAMGIGKGDHVAIWATNVPEWLLTLFACTKIGAVLVTVNTAYKVFELEYLLRQSDTRALVLIDGWKKSDYVEIMNELCPDLKDSVPGQFSNPRLPFLRTVIYAGNKEEAPAGMLHWNELEPLGEEVPYSRFKAVYDSTDPHDIINMQYTSGTTGFPKGVMLTHYNIVNNGKGIGDCMKFTEKDKLCIVVPFFHCFGLVLATMASLTHCTSMVPVDLYDPK